MPVTTHISSSSSKRLKLFCKSYFPKTTSLIAFPTWVAAQAFLQHQGPPLFKYSFFVCLFFHSRAILEALLCARLSARNLFLPSFMGPLLPFKDSIQGPLKKEKLHLSF